MNLLRELIRNAAATYQLQPRYYWLTTSVGLTAMAVGIPLMLAMADVLAGWLGLTPRGPIGSQANGAAWVALFLVSIPVSLYVSAVVVASLAGFVMVQLGLLSPIEAIQYALRSKYPARWFKPQRNGARP